MSTAATGQAVAYCGWMAVYGLIRMTRGSMGMPSRSSLVVETTSSMIPAKIGAGRVEGARGEVLRVVDGRVSPDGNHRHLKGHFELFSLSLWDDLFSYICSVQVIVDTNAEAS